MIRTRVSVYSKFWCMFYDVIIVFVSFFFFSCSLYTWKCFVLNLLKLLTMLIIPIIQAVKFEKQNQRIQAAPSVTYMMSLE